MAAESSRKNSLEPVFQAVFQKNRQLHEAIALSDDARVDEIDRELDALVASLLSEPADDAGELRLQSHVLTRLIQENADDRASVLYHVGLLSSLLDRFFAVSGEEKSRQGLSRRHAPSSELAALSDEPFMGDAVLNSLPEKIAVITQDYRYRFVNLAFTGLMNTSESEVVGRSIYEFGFDAESRQALRLELDRCFGGSEGRVACQIIPCQGHPIPATGRLSPVRDLEGEVTGALLVVTNCSCTADGIAA